MAISIGIAMIHDLLTFHVLQQDLLTDSFINFQFLSFKNRISPCRFIMQEVKCRGLKIFTCQLNFLLFQILHSYLTPPWQLPSCVVYIRNLLAGLHSLRDKDLHNTMPGSLQAKELDQVSKYSFLIFYKWFVPLKKIMTIVYTSQKKT